MTDEQLRDIAQLVLEGAQTRQLAVAMAIDELELKARVGGYLARFGARLQGDCPAVTRAAWA